MLYTLYILECSDGSFYTGITTNLQRRLSEHFSGNGALHVKARLPAKLIFSIPDIPNYKNARYTEKYVKRLSRDKKIKLISGDGFLLMTVQNRAFWDYVKTKDKKYSNSIL